MPPTSPWMLRKPSANRPRSRFTQYFKDVASSRKVGPKLTSEETALLKVLNSTVSVDFKDASLKEVMEFLDAKSEGKLNIFLDQNSIKVAGVDYESKVNFKGKRSRCGRCSRRCLGTWG